MLRARGLPLFSVDTHRPAATSTSSPSTCRPSSSTRTCSTASTSPACRCGRPSAAPSDPLVVRRRPLHLQPRAARRLRRLLRARRRRGGRVARSPRWCASGSASVAPRAPASTCCAALAQIPGVYVPSMYEVTYDGDAPRRRHAPVPRRARRGSRSARSPTWPSGRTRSTSSCRSPRSCTTGSTSRSSAAAPAAAGSARPA